jgi:hypothetical protein
MADPVMQAVRFDGRDKAMRLNKIKDRNRDKFSPPSALPDAGSEGT